MGKKNRSVLIYAIVIVIVLMAMVMLVRESTQTVSLHTYSEIMAYFDDYKVSAYTFDLGTGELVMQVEGENDPITYTVPNVSVFMDEIQLGDENYRKEYNERHPDAPLEQDYYKIQDNSWLYNFLPSLLLIVLMVIFMVVMMRQANGGGKINNFGKANIRDQSRKKNTFDDVAGADEEKFELEEIVDYLKNPKKYTDIGARIPKGVLLEGPPGTGKTLLAKAVAGEAGVPFFSISGSDFVEMFVGVGASRVRDLFETAKKNAPSIVFIDEIDAVGRHRGAGLGGGHDEREQTLNQLLVEMDGFEGNEGVIVMAATNRHDILDPALLRPGRFDRQIVVSYPDIKGREAILKVHTRNKPLGPDVDLKVIAQSTAGFTGAELENLTNEAALLAARQNRKAITKEDIEEATIKVIAGPEKKSHVMSPEEKKVVAYHEAGHAVASYYLPTQDKVHQITIIPRGSAGGMTIQLPEKEPSLLNMTARKIKEEIVTLMGGRVAEQIIIGEGSAGAVSDLQRATKLAKALVTQYGLSEKLGPVVYSDDNSEPFVGMEYGHSKAHSEDVLSEIDKEVRSIIDEGYERTVELLNAHIEKLHLVAKTLLVHEKVDNDEFEAIMNGKTSPEKIEAEYEEYLKNTKALAEGKKDGSDEETGELSEEKAEDTAPEGTDIPEEKDADTAPESTDISEEKDASAEAPEEKEDSGDGDNNE
ncbi:MAG: ATP-dependent zinc metalloprotease FtsH [Oscillospiraceae bacterium]|nr:ATP-dependent zinc metalloprotease FtsH [Oscillospiraceae bacterium]